MANISITGAEELLATLQKADIFDDKMQQEILYAAGDIIVEELQKAVQSSGFRTEHYATSTLRRSSATNPEIRISPSRQRAKTSTGSAGLPCSLS